MLAANAKGESGDSDVVSELLGLLTRAEADSAAAVRYDDGEGTTVRTHGAEATVTASGRMFPAFSHEHVIALPGVRDATLHLAANAWTDGAAALRLVEHAAAVVALVHAHEQATRRLRLMKEQAVQLQKLAELGRLGAAIAHELNNPLTSIIAYSDHLTNRLQSGSVDPTDVERMVRISEAASRIQQFARELTDYSRPASRLVEPLEIHAVIDRALSFCKHVLPGADITIERSYSDVPSIEGMQTPLTQAFVNLVTNAWHAMDGVTGTLRISTSVRDDRVVVAVADQGTGIPQDVLPRIFEPYFSTKPKGHGIGLGLSIVRQVVSDQGGTIRAEPNEPQGTVFIIELPIRG